jgi:hypothetical protein
MRPRRHLPNDNGFSNDNRDSIESSPSLIADYEPTEIQEQRGDMSDLSYPGPLPPPPPFALPYLDRQRPSAVNQEELKSFVNFSIAMSKIYILFFSFCSSYIPKRSLPLSNFMMEIGALLVVFIICMVLVLAIRADETKLRTTMQVRYIFLFNSLDNSFLFKACLYLCLCRFYPMDDMVYI